MNNKNIEENNINLNKKNDDINKYLNSKIQEQKSTSSNPKNNNQTDNERILSNNPINTYNNSFEKKEEKIDSFKSDISKINSVNNNKKEENKIENNENNEEDSNNKEKIKEKVQRLKLDDKTLLYSENGMKKYYDIITSTNFNDPDNKNNLDKLTSLFRNWHFLLFPNYDMEFFVNKLVDLGKKAPCKSYMSRLRKIYKGEESWDIMYEDQNNILGKASILNEKEFQNPNNNNNNNNEKKTELKNKNKEIKNNSNEEDFDVMNNLNPEDNLIIEDLIFGDDKTKNIKKENKSESNIIKEEDFENFDYDPEEIDKIDSNIKKRTFSEALPHTKNSLITTQPKL